MLSQTASVRYLLVIRPESLTPPSLFAADRTI